MTQEDYERILSELRSLAAAVADQAIAKNLAGQETSRRIFDPDGRYVGTVTVAWSAARS